MTAAWLEVMPPLSPGVYVRRRATPPFPLQDPRCTLFARARHGLWHGVHALGLAPPDEILAPAYHHGSEIEALVRAGLTCRFYDATPTLEPDDGELDRLLSERTRALYLIHYIGVPQDGARWRRWCDKRGLLLIEDAAQAWLASFDDGEPVGSLGDLSLFCLYKTFGVPDGAAVVAASGPLPGGTDSRLHGTRALVGRHVRWLRSRSGVLGRDRSRTGAEPYVREKDFALGDPASTPSTATRVLLPRVDGVEVAARRRVHYQLLLDEVGELVPAPFGAPGPGASPFGFPVEADDKARLLERLRSEGIAALDFWSEPHPSTPERFVAAAERRRRTVLLPVHHELRRQDVERLAKAVQAAPRSPPPLELEPLDDPETLEGAAVASEWDELAERSRNIFATRQWLATWWRHFGRGRPLLLTACRARGGRLAAVLPLYAASGHPFRVLRFVGHGPGDQLGPVCARAERPAAARALRRLLRERADEWDVFVGDELLADEGWSALLGAKTLSRQASPVLRSRGRTWDDVLGTMSSSARKKIRYEERRLAREHDLRYRLVDDPGTLNGALDALFALHSARWSGDSPFLRAEQFHRDFAARALRRGWLRLWLLELDGDPVAAWYGFRYGGVESYYQSGRDPHWRQMSVGSVLVVHSIRAAIEDGAEEYRFLRGEEEFKGRFADADHGLETVVLSRGLIGGAATAVRPLARRYL